MMFVGFCNNKIVLACLFFATLFVRNTTERGCDKLTKHGGTDLNLAF